MLRHVPYLLISFLVAGLLSAAETARKPNIVFILADDLGETRNRAKEMPDKAKELHAKMLAWREAINAPMPTPNTNDTSTVKVRAKKRNRKAAE
jgi:hypothetical protein